MMATLRCGMFSRSRRGDLVLEKVQISTDARTHRGAYTCNHPQQARRICFIFPALNITVVRMRIDLFTPWPTKKHFYLPFLFY